MKVICGTLFSHEEIEAAAEAWSCDWGEALSRLMDGEMCDAVLEVLSMANVHRGDARKVH
jgi:hypothetical protein